MQRGELSGLVLTHNGRDPRLVIQQLATVCEQVVLVNDARFGEFELNGNPPDNCELTVVERHFDNFPDQRNAGIEKALGSWVLSVDSDELLTEKLTKELAELEPTPGAQVYALPRTEIIKGQCLQNANLYSSYHPRLFKSSMRYAALPKIHEEFADFDYGTVVNLNYGLTHQPEENNLELIVKAFGYGQQWFGDRYSWGQVFGSIPSLMLRRGYWRDRMNGLAMASVQASFRLGTKLQRNN
ncbi:MAG: hypothetical protein ABI716_02020 [Candidatus Saccharibacteria bacterium]